MRMRRWVRDSRSSVRGRRWNEYGFERKKGRRRERDNGGVRQTMDERQETD